MVDKAVIYKSFWNITQTAWSLAGSFLAYLYNINLGNVYCLSHLFREQKDVNIIFSHKDRLIKLDSSLLYGYHFYLTKLISQDGH